MCQNDYNKENGKNKHLKYAEKTMIERWYNKDKKSIREIAELLSKSKKTISREIKRGLTTNLTSELIEIKVYSADISNAKYNYHKTGKGPMIKLDNNIKLVNHIEKEIVKNKKSPEAIVTQLKENGFDIAISARTIRNTIDKGGVFENIISGKIIYKKERKDKNPEKRTCSKVPAEKSIEYRPVEANNRSEYGHWEGDLVIGTITRNNVLLTLTERKTREEIIMLIKGKKAKSVAKALDKLEVKYGTEFKERFKTITFDNGSEFRKYEMLEKSLFFDEKRTTVYYAHPYCSGERETNENSNRLIRRWIPKGVPMTNITEEFVQKIEDWINNYPRKIFGYKSSNMILEELKCI